MLTSLILATLLTISTFILLITLDRSSAVFEVALKRLLTLTRRSKLLTTYLLKAYIAYRKHLQMN